MHPALVYPLVTNAQPDTTRTLSLMALSSTRTLSIMTLSSTRTLPLTALRPKSVNEANNGNNDPFSQ